MADPHAWGIDPGYEDVTGAWREAPPASVRALLGAMGAAGPRPPDAPARVVRRGEDPRLGRAVEVVFEDGRVHPAAALDASTLPLGYHRMIFDNHEAQLIVSPGVCFLPRTKSWGWAVQLYAVRSTRSWGMGDIGDLRRLGRWARAQGAGVMMLNPLHAAAPGPQQPSPYFPSSRIFRNPLYLRVGDVPGAERVANDLEELARKGRALNEGERIDRDEVYRLKMEALERIWSSGRPVSRDLDRYVAARGDPLRRFATYMALREHFGNGPESWPHEYRTPGSAATRRWTEEHRDRVRFHQWLQWLLDVQLDQAGDEIDIVHDLAVGVAPDGADAWVWDDVFATGVTVGAPPDEFNASGQNWMFPPMDPWKLRAASYEPFIETARAGLRHGAGVRVDHVMGLFRLFWIPEGTSPAEGAYVRYPHEDLLNILALESYRARGYVVGEDLGTVEPLVREEMAARTMLSQKIMWFEEGAPNEYPETSVAAITNHDLPTVAGLWAGADLEEQRALGLTVNEAAHAGLKTRLQEQLRLDADASIDEVLEATHRSLARAPSAIVVATLEDALAMKARPNLPGTTEERPNWSLPLPEPLEELEQHPRARLIARVLSAGVGAAPPLDVAHRYADVGVRLHYVEGGKGPPVVMLHGFPDFWYSWRNQIPALADAGLRVVAPDMRGYNLSEKPPGIGSYRIHRLVSDVARLIEHLGEPKAHVVGHDWGAVVAWFFAMARPDLLDRLVILNVPHPERYVGRMNFRQFLKSWYVWFFQVPRAPERYMSADDFLVLRKLFVGDPARSDAFTPHDIELYIEAAARADALHYPINYYRAMGRTSPRRVLSQMRRIPRPVMVIWGEKDRFLDGRLAAPDPALVPDCRVERFPDASHWVHMDKPPEVNALLIDFLLGRT